MLIAANTPVPCDRTRVFRTASDDQVAVIVRVSQGESERFADNTCLGDMELSGIKAAPRGEAQIEVIFEIDADGILNVRAKDLDSGHETGAKMRLVGARNEAADVAQMISRQGRHPVE
jgi:molecular chaperone DnaK